MLLLRRHTANGTSSPCPPPRLPSVSDGLHDIARNQYRLSPASERQHGVPKSAGSLSAAAIQRAASSCVVSVDLGLVTATQKQESRAIYSLSPRHRTIRHLCLIRLKKNGVWQALLLSHAAVEQASHSLLRRALASIRAVFVAPLVPPSRRIRLLQPTSRSLAPAPRHPTAHRDNRPISLSLSKPPQYVAGHSPAVTHTQRARSQDSALGDLCDHHSSLLLSESRTGQGPTS